MEINTALAQNISMAYKKIVLILLKNRRLGENKIMKTLSQYYKKILRRLLPKILPNDFYFSHPGYCVCCDQTVTFECYHNWLRDHYVCTNCQCIPRERALMATIEKYYPNWRELRIHESSPIQRGASLKLKNQCKNYLASQYYPDAEYGTMVNGFRNENLESQTFADKSFDLVITQDVMEHVYNPDRVFSEIARTLATGGAHIFTVPMINKYSKTEVWATLNSDGTPNFLHLPEYHGNPVNPYGSPVTMHWGCDIIDYIYAASGLDTQIISLYDKHLGIMGEYNEVLITRKI